VREYSDCVILIKYDLVLDFKLSPCPVCNMFSFG